MKIFIDLGVAFIVLCATTAIVVAAAHHVLTPFIQRLTPAWRARVRFIALLAPVLVGVFGVIVALVPSVMHVAGLANDHCLNPAGHTHTHVCFVHGAVEASPVLATLVVVFALVVLGRLAFVVGRWRRSDRLFESMLATSSMRRLNAEREYLFTSDMPVCVTIGLVKPTVYISSAAVEALGDHCAAAALQHERGHIARHDTRARFVAAVADTFHIPGLARSILHHWQHDAELVCDQFAARRAASGTLVAEALVRFQRATLRSRAAPLCSGACLCARGAALNERVSSLLAWDASKSDGASDGGSLTYFAGFVLLIVVGGVGASRLHHAIESLVGFLADVVT